jgi:hypothetical protein
MNLGDSDSDFDIVILMKMMIAQAEEAVQAFFKNTIFVLIVSDTVTFVLIVSKSTCFVIGSPL